MGSTLWGTTRSYIASAVRGVSQGFQKELELHGVGFKARVEMFNKEDVQPSPALSTSAGEKRKKEGDKIIDRRLGGNGYESRVAAQAGVLPVQTEENVKKSPNRQALILRVGFSHEVRLVFPPHINVSTPSPTTVVISGIDKQQVGQAAKRVKLIRKPDPYKGKGIRYLGEVIKLKPGKRR